MTMTIGTVDVARRACLGCLRGVCNDHVDFALDEFGRQLREPSIVAFG